MTACTFSAKTVLIKLYFQPSNDHYYQLQLNINPVSTSLYNELIKKILWSRYRANHVDIYGKVNTVCTHIIGIKYKSYIVPAKLLLAMKIWFYSSLYFIVLINNNIYSCHYSKIRTQRYNTHIKVVLRKCSYFMPFYVPRKWNILKSLH